MRRFIRFILVVGLAALALPAYAGDGSASFLSAAPRSHHSTMHFRVYAAVDFDILAAKQSYKAVLGSSNVTAVGAGADVDVSKHAFVRAAFTHASKTGSRVFVDNGQVFSLGIPITISWTPIEVGGGWRFGRPASRVTPYVGGAFVALDYKETSNFAQAGDNVSKNLPGAEGFGGVEFGLGKWAAISGEAQYRTIPNALGAGGVSQDFNEKNAGGFTARVLIAFRR